MNLRGRLAVRDIGSTYPATGNQSSTVELRNQWHNPSDIFTILLLVGGDVIRTALAQLCGGFLTPVPFSFGWVSYSISALLSAVGDNKLLPSEPDCAGYAINAENGYIRLNHSWVIGRLLRDFEYWRDPDIQNQEADRLIKMRAQGIEENKRTIGLRIAIYNASGTKRAGLPDHDYVWWVGIGLSLTQLGIAAIPFVKYHEWTTFFVTGAGTFLALAWGALPQWKEEKWACPKSSTKTIVLTEGNGFQDCIVIRGLGHGLDLEKLACSRVALRATTRLYSLLLAAGWLVLLICIAGFQLHTWYLVGLGTLGMVWNVLVAGLPRRPGAFGIHLDYQTVILERKIMETLAQAEEQFPGLGAGLLPTFFPGKVNERERQWWNYAERRAVAYKSDRDGDPAALPHVLPGLRTTENIPTAGWL